LSFCEQTIIKPNFITLIDMKRRSFIKSSVVAAAAGAVVPQMAMSAENPPAKGSEFYELRTYILENEHQQRLVENYYEGAAIAALNRSGVENIGVFTELKPVGQTKIYVLIPYKSWNDFVTVRDNLANDKEYLEIGEPYLNAPATAPAYQRIESAMLKAFKLMPRMLPPAKNSRIFELRRYEHASESAGIRKLNMFNEGGEINIFKRLGFNPVFFGETIIGGLRPNLVYMLTFEDMDAHDRHWKAFGSDPEWKRISAIPENADAKLVSHITSVFLTPAACSQI